MKLSPPEGNSNITGIALFNHERKVANGILKTYHPR